MTTQDEDMMPVLRVAMNLRKGLMGHGEDVKECGQQVAC